MISQVSGTTATYRIEGLLASNTGEGTYQLTVDASYLTDLDGYFGTGIGGDSWLVDITPPTSHVVNTLGSSQASDSFAVTVAFTDRSGTGGAFASGISSVALYVSVNNGPFALYQTSNFSPTATGTATFTFVGNDRNIYAFHSVAYDAAGNAEIKNASTTEASTSVPDLNPPVTHILAEFPRTHGLRSHRRASAERVRPRILAASSRSTGPEPIPTKTRARPLARSHL